MEIFNQDVLLDCIDKSFTINFNSKKKISIAIALSGGKDSICLFHLLVRLSSKYKFKLFAIHVDHGLQEVSKDWVLFCESFCKKYNVELLTTRFKLNLNSKLGIEAEAREQRYKFLLNSKADIIALAHHRQDQIETYFLSILRGGGLRGIVSMPEVRFINNKTIWRPLLSINRNQINEYIKINELPYVEDETNDNQDYLRNWVRHSLIPFIEKKIPNINSHVEHSIDNLQGILRIIDEQINDDLQLLLINEKIDFKKLLTYSYSKQKEILRFFLQKNNLNYYSKANLDNILSILHNSSNAKIELPNGLLYLYNNYLYYWINDNVIEKLLSGKYIDKKIINWDKSSKLGFSEKFINNTNWYIRNINNKDIIDIGIGKKKAIKFLQDKKIPPFLRKIWPVIVDEYDNCIAIIGIRIDEKYLVNNGFLPNIDALKSYLS